MTGGTRASKPGRDKPGGSAAPGKKLKSRLNTYFKGGCLEFAGTSTNPSLFDSQET